ncbi:hypothetical protein HPB51_012937 [Rhipicephalus microplus]|uniref:Rap-GAP domain-containing protein n=1 Tax=Rhipicephalus microplus TaxID=6941 RepID=A0A9J6F2J7_RHIMP|nr:hypothetical protein HPB51_012937 [Rhipicephalus microplus]
MLVALTELLHEQEHKLRQYNKSVDWLHEFYLDLLKFSSSYSELWSIVKLLLVLSHGQATVEQGFSVNRLVCVENLKDLSYVRIDRSVGVFDHILTYETHKMGLLYVGPGQLGREQCILSNTHGSVRYTALLLGLGSLVRLSELDPRRTYLGGLACSGEDGTHCLCWQDDVTQGKQLHHLPLFLLLACQLPLQLLVDVLWVLVFHVATLMPNMENDRQRGNKKRHIGNDYVHIVYNESSEPYDLATIRGDCHCVCVVVQPLKLGHNLVSLVGKPGE